MKPTTILTCFISPALCTQFRTFPRRSRLPRQDATEPVIEDFPVSEITARTGVDPSNLLPNLDASLPDDLSCTNKPGPDRIGCPEAIGVWTTFANEAGQINIAAGTCKSATLSCCQAVACASKGDVSPPVEDITGRMWNPVTSKCVSGGAGGIWEEKATGLYVMLENPGGEECAS